jgi:hypothetical protein
MATLTVSYNDSDGAHMQTVRLENFNVGEFHQSEDALSKADVIQMLQEIIKVGGGSV